MGSIETNAPIPIIDISSHNSRAPHQLLDAASRYGFVYIENNEAGIAPAEIEEMFRLSKEFFAASVEEKETVSIKSNSVGKNHGWLSQGVEKLDPRSQKRADVKEAFNIGESINGVFHQPLSPTLAPHAATIIAFQNACQSVCQRLNTLFAVALGLEEDWFTSRHSSVGEWSSSIVFRMLYYPYTPTYESGIDIRAGAHADYGSLTLLFQQRGQPGLEILTPEGEWAAVPVDPRREAEGEGNLPILLNIGDLLEDWTGGLLKSTVHRVVFPGQGREHGDRYSMAYFYGPRDEVELVPVPSRLVEEFVAKRGIKEGQGKKIVGRVVNGRTLTAADHLREKLASSYSIAS